MPHLSYLFCSAWGLHLVGPVPEIACGAIGGVPDPVELMEEAGMAGRRARLADRGVSGGRPEEAQRTSR